MTIVAICFTYRVLPAGRGKDGPSVPNQSPPAAWLRHAHCQTCTVMQSNRPMLRALHVPTGSAENLRNILATSSTEEDGLHATLMTLKQSSDLVCGRRGAGKKAPRKDPNTTTVPVKEAVA